MPLQFVVLLALPLVLLTVETVALSWLPLDLVRGAWGLCAAFLVACFGYLLLRRFLGGGRGFLSRVLASVRSARAAQEERLLRVHELDPVGGSDQLLDLMASYLSGAVREAALARATSATGFYERLARELERGRAEPALAAVEFAPLGPAEVQLLAAPARRAIERITAEVRREHGNLPAPLRKRRCKAGQHLFRKVAAKLAAGGIDHEPAIESFVATLRADELPYE